MAISTALERVTYGAPAGWIGPGQHRQIISEAVATRTLLPEESGALCLFDRAAGVVYTLPAPVVGLQFEFGIALDGTSNAYKVITNAGTVFLTGGLFYGSTTTTNTDVFVANGSSHTYFSLTSAETGWLKGQASVWVTCISATQWYVQGTLSGTGTMSTPFA